jgi:hypothetical protein
MIWSDVIIDGLMTICFASGFFIGLIKDPFVKWAIFTGLLMSLIAAVLKTLLKI